MKVDERAICVLLVLFGSHVSVLAQCPTYEDESSEAIMGSFVSTPHWNSIKADNGLSGVTSSDIVKLNLPAHQNICTSLNTESNDMFTDYHVYYYKVKNRYIVVSVLKQPEDPDYVAVGLSFLDIYDASFNRLNGYSF